MANAAEPIAGESITGSILDRWDLRTRLQERDHDLLVLQPGRPVELTGPVGYGLTRVGLRMLVEPSRTAPVVILDVRGWASPQAAWEVGVEGPVFVRCPDVALWARVAAALVEGVPALYAEVPRGVSDQDLRRLAALIRSRQSRVVLRPVEGGLPSGIGYLRLRAREIHWDGADRGHGRLRGRRLVLEASGKGVAGMNKTIEVDDAGTHDLRVVSDLAAGQAGRAFG
ncbi:MAG TPA: hypothetical protein VLB67_04000 [Acidimicrobiia bacterium]|nr:hypothetical protein [Acidimicrobiia bacterium]